jgi:hypothetical protein
LMQRSHIADYIADYIANHQQVFGRQTSQKMAEVAKIPVIDISGDGDQTQVAKELVEAAIEHGFVYIKNTGKDIPVDAIDGAFEMVNNVTLMDPKLLQLPDKPAVQETL